MELWRVESDERPKAVSMANLLLALCLHLAVFSIFFAYAWLHGLFSKEEKIIPIDLTVIVNENLDGVENEPPPLKNPDPPEQPKPLPLPEPPKKIEAPKPLEQIVTNIVEKKEAPKKKEVPKKKEPPKKEPPKKTKAELLKERIEKMRSKAKTINSKKVTIEVKDVRESGNGRTQRQPLSAAEINRRLNEGFKPGTSNQLPTSEEQRCLSLVQMAINDMWDRLQPKVGDEGQVLLSVQFNSAGGMTNVRLSRGCGDKLSDEAALSVARRITAIPGLSAEFISKYRSSPVTLRYNVRAR